MSPDPAPLRPRVLITRAAEDARPLAEVVEQCGGEAVCVPAVQTVPLPLDGPRAIALASLGSYRAIGFGSRHGARLMAHHLGTLGLQVPPTCALFAVGPATAACMTALYGRSAELAPPYTGPGLAAHMGARLHPGDRVLLPTACGAGEPLAQALQQVGLRAQRLELYGTQVVDYRADAEGASMTAASDVDYIVFTSPSCVRGYLGWGLPLGHARLLTIGPTTSAAVTRHGLRVYAEAAPSSFEGLCALVKAVLCPHLHPSTVSS